MKGFSTHNGDVVLNKDIEMVNGSELLRQKAVRVIGTNQGEWKYDLEEGIDFRVVLCKNPNKDEIRATIEQALMRKVDETFVITEFDMEVVGRDATISFRAVNSEGVEIGGEYTYAG